MREIKFRCFVPAEGDYYYIQKGDECWLQFIDDKAILFIEDEKWESGSGEWVSYPCVREVEDFIIEQFTGLCDKNGKEIYEGDILKFLDDETCISSVRFDLGAFGMDWWPGQKHKQWVTFNKIAHGFNPEEFEIIGNIHENPELLK